MFMQIHIFLDRTKKNDGIGGELFYFLNILTSTVSWMFYILLRIVWILRIFAYFTPEAIASEIFFNLLIVLYNK